MTRTDTVYLRPYKMRTTFSSELSVIRMLISYPCGLQADRRTYRENLVFSMARTIRNVGNGMKCFLSRQLGATDKSERHAMFAMKCNEIFLRVAVPQNSPGEASSDT